MTESMIRSLVEEHSIPVFGMQYALRVEWMALDDAVDQAPAYWIRVELNAAYETTDAPMQMHVMVAFSDPSELPSLIRDAVHRQLSNSPHHAAVPPAPFIRQLAWTLMPGLRDARLKRDERAA